jgi:hypothetical protein
MLIRWANENDISAWCELATEVSPVFQHPADMGKDTEFISYAKSKTSKYEAAAFIQEVQRVGRVLRKVTGAEKINYEMHVNSGAHLHIHLFPRYLDDDFPSAPIDYRVNEPAPYGSYEEYLWFIDRMKEELL